ncbi:MAG TPA: hypothetical protein PKZ54_04930 [Syntrophorhabdaceae bacterium]|nr:hypothetical protein [Syntrophorhabdaceae bacterium]
MNYPFKRKWAIKYIANETNEINGIDGIDRIDEINEINRTYEIDQRVRQHE